MKARPDFENSIRPELPVLYRVARRMVSSDDEAADLVQQTLLKSFQAWGRFDGRHLRSWLIQILRNENRMRLRSKGRHETEDISDNDIADTSFWDEVHWRHQANQLLVELDKLAPEFRIAIVLCDIEEMSYDEVAIAMDIPVGTVRSRLSRGRALLRKKLTEVIND
ncbi:MAG: sigma-70 family RNA polymerase sigma factor [Fimbriimonadaceae bacterium]